MDIIRTFVAVCLIIVAGVFTVACSDNDAPVAAPAPVVHDFPGGLIVTLPDGTDLLCLDGTDGRECNALDTINAHLAR